MTRLELFQAVKTLSHRNDVTDFFDTALQMGESRIAKDLRTTELITFAQIDTSTAPEINPGAFALPVDYLEMRDVISPTGGRRLAMKSVSRAELSIFTSGGGTGSLFYSIYDGVIEFRPSPQGATIDLIYFAKNAPLVDDADTNDTIKAFPEIYIFATLVGVWTWAQNANEKADSLQEFERAVTEANTFAENQRFGTAMRQYSGNRYVRHARWA